MALSKPHILFFNPVRHAFEAFKKLSSIAQTEVIASKSRSEFFSDVKEKYKDIVAIYSTSSSYAASFVPHIYLSWLINIGYWEVRSRVDPKPSTDFEIHLP